MIKWMIKVEAPVHFIIIAHFIVIDQLVNNTQTI